MQAKAARLLGRPKLTTLWAAGLSFARCHAERAVPYDPHTPYIFWGEEFSRTARFFTNGYDIYTPSRTIVAHDYKRAAAPLETGLPPARAGDATRAG